MYNHFKEGGIIKLFMQPLQFGWEGFLFNFTCNPFNLNCWRGGGGIIMCMLYKLHVLKNTHTHVNPERLF